MNTAHLVCAFLVRRIDGQWWFLQLQRTPDAYMGGTFQLVAGGIQPGETAIEAILREIKEETGYEPIELYQLDVINSFYLAVRDTIYHCPMFCAIVPATIEPTLNDEHVDYRWMPVTLYSAALMWPGERAAAAEMVAEILGNGPAKPFLRIGLTP